MNDQVTSQKRDRSREPGDLSVRDEVRRFILNEFLSGEDPEALTDTTPLVTGGILDSIASVRLVSHLEDRFGVRFEAHEISVDYLDSIECIARTIHHKTTP